MKFKPKTKRCRLSQEQPGLYRNIAALSVTLVLIGVPMLFGPNGYTPNANDSIIQQLLPLQVHGLIFIGLAIMLLINNYSYQRNYRRTRITLSVILGFMIAWLLSLTLALIPEPRSVPVVAIWGYMTWTIFNLSNDPGFRVSEIIRNVRNGNG